MASMSPCTIEQDVLDAMKKFRRLSNKSTMAILLRCDMKTNQVVIDKEFKDLSVEALIDELPSREPRFILHSHELKHADGRIQYPLNLILYIPDGCGTNNRFTYASTANSVSAASGITRIIELREDISPEWLSKELQKTY
ncbi:unnamed protein product [Rotaria socialis]|uniref:ADF-H domain-containing protein n=5 Tax=Rotaria TaxID=231623 RepID=A0A816LCI7_9BILA|nr:unnamed protein product [Rotaria magnacalcarata]CAF3088426.1 unnamed protein product [Rotaria socialis]CAF1323291.1 unnamed protein product [Rotaria magnacalcarata]CAF1930573.1 unnamed protein product [Rotaria magnacalcarata]CAF1932688.1 unnamed protein product [Rotaria magnacalcarata]